MIYCLGLGNVLWFSSHQHITMETIKISNFTPKCRSLQFIALLSKLTDFKLLSANRSFENLYLHSSKETNIMLSKTATEAAGV